MWRVATAVDDEVIIAMCLALNAEDQGQPVAQPEQVRLTIAKLREQPYRGPRRRVLAMAFGAIRAGSLQAAP
jgi:hypothetical protein